MTMNKDRVSLLPCPFCGAPAEVDMQRRFRAVQSGGLETGVAISCAEGCHVEMMLCRSDLPEYDDDQLFAALAEQWNRRASAVVTVDEIAQLIREVDGDNTMGAGQLAEALLGRLVPAALSVRAEPVAVKPDPWVDTRLVRFDDTIVFGHGGFDFDRWESLRWEMHTPEGSWAVWKSDADRWSMYGGPSGLLALDKYASEEHAKADAEECARSLSEWHRSALVAEPEAVNYADTVAPYVAALRMVREAIGELFGPIADLESEEAVLLRGPEPHHDAEALIAALQRIRSALVARPAEPTPQAETEPDAMDLIRRMTAAADGIELIDMEKASWRRAYEKLLREAIAIIRQAVQAASPAPSIPAGFRLVPEVPTHRHKKRGTEYVLIGIGKMQTERWYRRHGVETSVDVDMHPVALYQAVDDGSLWARPIEEWQDGRFEVITAPSQPQVKGEGE